VDEMTKEQLAAMLKRSKYPLSLTNDLRKQAKENGLLVVYGASDDLIEFDGCFRDELGCGDKTSVLINRTGALDPDFEDDESSIEHAFFMKYTSKEIVTIFGDGEYTWQYKTDIPHASFDIIDNDNLYCKAMVINVDDISIIKDFSVFESCLKTGLAIEKAAAFLPDHAEITLSIERVGWGCDLKKSLKSINMISSEESSIEEAIEDLIEKARQ